jgi:SAM-dependent methyltransferase
MDRAAAQKLLALNRQFYQTFALQFSDTRGRLQPGVQRILAGLPGEARLLDLGCGNGELARALAQRGQRGLYVGLDISQELLAIARTAARPGDSLVCVFEKADLAASDWEIHIEDLPGLSTVRPAAPPFDFILAFAVLHHLPGRTLRLEVLNKVYDLLAPSGWFIFSVWQFLDSPRLRARLQPWEAAGLNPAEVDPGDALLDWRHGGQGLRYAHHFTTGELDALAGETGFRAVESFRSDGEGGRLGHYGIWERI